MTLEFEDDEMKLLTHILTSRRASLGNQVRRAETPDFKDDLKDSRDVLDRILTKIGAAPDLSLPGEVRRAG